MYNQSATIITNSITKMMNLSLVSYLMELIITTAKFIIAAFIKVAVAITISLPVVSLKTNLDRDLIKPDNCNFVAYIMGKNFTSNYKLNHTIVIAVMANKLMEVTFTLQFLVNSFME